MTYTRNLILALARLGVNVSRETFSENTNLYSSPAGVYGFTSIDGIVQKYFVNHKEVELNTTNKAVFLAAVKLLQNGDN